MPNYFDYMLESAETQIDTYMVSQEINEAYEFSGGSFENIGNKVNDRYGEDIENMRDAANGMMGGRFRYA